MKLLAVSDKIVDWIYSSKIRLVLSDIDIALGCGDLPLEYLEFIVSSLDIPLYYVHGNHSLPENLTQKHEGHGSECLHGKVINYRGYTFAGIEGSLRYNYGIYQYSQLEMWLNVIKLIPSIISNKRKYGHYLDVFVTHAPPWGIHDQPDLPHQGIKAFRWFISAFQPVYHFHGHIHIYRPDTVITTQFGNTKVINAYGYQQVNF
jgi:Icc-related predicted phosphoesterase